MKFKIKNTTIILLVILLLALLIGTLIGFGVQEGITYNKLTVLHNILTNKNLKEGEKMNAINDMNLSEDKNTSIKDVVNSEDKNNKKIDSLIDKVNDLNSVNLYNKTYAEAWPIDIE